MRTTTHKEKAAGFAVVETLLVLIILAAIVGVGAYVLHQKDNADKTLSSGSSSPKTSAPSGTTAAVDELSQQDAKAETGIDNSSDKTVQQDAGNANGALTNLGGAYNEANF